MGADPGAHADVLSFFFLPLLEVCPSFCFHKLGQILLIIIIIFFNIVLFLMK